MKEDGTLISRRAFALSATAAAAVAAPAAEAYRDLVLNKWWTRWSGTAGADGTVVLRAFYGKHRVTVNRRETIVDLKQSAGVAVVDVP